MSHFRYVLAAVIAPLAAPITVMLVGLSVGRNIWQDDDADIWLIFWLITASSYFAWLVAGLPIVYVLRTLQRISLGALAVAGAISGIVLSVVHLLLFGLVFNSSVAINLIEIVLGAILGVSVAFVFGLIAGINNLREK